MMNDKFSLRREYLDRSGYINGGSYYVGVGAPVYYFAADGDGRQGLVRGASRAEAKAEVRKQFPDAKFYR